MITVNIRNIKTNKQIDSITVDSECTIKELKELFCSKNKISTSQQSFKADKVARALSDDYKLAALGSDQEVFLLFKDLGRQISWRTVFLVEYSGPPVIYLSFYVLFGIYHSNSFAHETKLLCTCAFVAHYLKRFYETVFVHRFSHATMPVFNLFKNCTYYWGFAAYIAYCNTHVYYTTPYFGRIQLYGGLTCFLLSEIGNFFVHTTLRDLRPPGSKVRKVPYATWNPFTWLFNYVSCPNYFYEFLTWVSFSVATQSLPALIFAAVGFIQMADWALKKHSAYKKEFTDYPRKRKAIIPFLL